MRIFDSYSLQCDRVRRQLFLLFMKVTLYPLIWYVRQGRVLRIHRNIDDQLFEVGKYSGLRQTIWMDPILDLIFQTFHWSQLGWWKSYENLTNSMIRQYSSRYLRNTADRDRTFSPPYINVMSSDELVQLITPWVHSKRKEKTFHYSMTRRRQIPVSWVKIENLPVLYMMNEFLKRTWDLERNWLRKIDKKLEKFISYLFLVRVSWIMSRKITEWREWGTM